MNKKLLSTLTIIAVISFSLLVFGMVYENTLPKIVEEVNNASIGAILGAIVTVLLLSQQTASEELKERNVSVFEKKSQVYNEFMNELWKVWDDRKIDRKEFGHIIRLVSQTIVPITEPKIVKEILEKLQLISEIITNPDFENLKLKLNSKNETINNIVKSNEEDQDGTRSKLIQFFIFSISDSLNSNIIEKKEEINNHSIIETLIDLEGGFVDPVERFIKDFKKSFKEIIYSSSNNQNYEDDKELEKAILFFKDYQPFEIGSISYEKDFLFLRFRKGSMLKIRILINNEHHKVNILSVIDGNLGSPQERAFQYSVLGNLRSAGKNIGRLHLKMSGATTDHIKTKYNIESASQISINKKFLEEQFNTDSENNLTPQEMAQELIKIIYFYLRNYKVNGNNIFKIINEVSKTEIYSSSIINAINE